MVDKYIELLLKKCINIQNKEVLFINADIALKEFAERIKNKAYNLGVKEVYIDYEDINVLHDKLLKLSMEEIRNDPYFDKSIVDFYAKKDACFLILDTEFPEVLDDIDSKKIAMSKLINKKTRPIYREKVNKGEISWCIAVVANEIWAKKIFKNDNNAYQKLENFIYKACMVDTNNPIESWKSYIKKNLEIINKINDLKIKKLHYKNSLGTNLVVEMPNESIWNSIANQNKGLFISNMPSYEIFSTPDYRKTNGIVYSSLPLIYCGERIDDFYLEFKNGKIVDCNAKKGKEILLEIINGSENDCYLGEVALVNFDSPIRNTNIIFETTLLDENAACHLALGDGFPECIKNGVNMTKKELLKNGINQSDNHIDFMIGTEDLEIEADTKYGKKLIFKKENFNI